MAKVSVRVDGMMILALTALGAAAYVYMNRNRFNPASRDNFIYQSVEGDTLDTIGDYVFGGIDLVNPFNESDIHAETVYGLRD